MDHSLTNHLLIAMPHLQEMPFYRSVIFVAEHNIGGAMGLIINQPTDLPFSKILEQFELTGENEGLKRKVLRGGPLKKENGFILHHPQGHWRATVNIGEDLGLTTSRDILAAMVATEGPQDALIILGCAGWLPGQLEEEMRNNIWLSVKTDPYILFDCPYHDRWHKAAELIGVDIDRLSCAAGHA